MYDIELTCDAIAVATLQKLGEDPKLLISALEKVEGFNRVRFGDAIDQTSHPPLRERRERVKRLLREQRGLLGLPFFDHWRKRRADYHLDETAPSAGAENMVDETGIEPATSSLRTRRSPS
jgi:hypothetical protein